MGGSGGTSGKVGFPSYMESWHDTVIGGGSTPNLTLAAAMNNVFGASPYSGSPASTTHLENTLDNWGSRVGNEIDNLDHEADWASALSKAVTEVITNSALDDLDPAANQKPDATTGADDLLANAEAAVSTEVDSRISPETDWDSLVNKIVTVLDSATTFLQAVSNPTIADPSISAPSSVTSSAPTAPSVAHTPSIDIATEIDNAQTDATNEVQEALTKAKDFVNNNLIDPVITEFENRVNSRLAERKRSVSSLFADVNAVHSSAFLISQALLERDAQREVNQRDAEMTQQMYSQAFQSHVEAFGSALNSLAQARYQESQEKFEVASQEAQHQYDANALGEQLATQASQVNAELETQVNTEQASLKVDTDTAEARNQLQANIEESQQRLRFILNNVQAIVGLINEKLGYEQTGWQLYGQTYTDALQTYFQAAVRNKAADDNLIGQGTQNMLQTSRQDTQLSLSEERAFQQAASADFEARQTAEEYQTQLDGKAAFKDLRAHERAAVMLGAPSGAAATLPEESSDTSQVIGGALTGAGVGASVGSAIAPGIGTAIGAGVGAVVGGVGGALK